MRTDEHGEVPTSQRRNAAPLRLLLIDDCLAAAEALASRLSSAPGLRVMGRCASTDPSLPEIVRGLRPDVITVEAGPACSPAGEVLRQIAAACPEARVVVLSADHDLSGGVEAARAGAAAWVAEDQGAAALALVLRGVHEGKSWFPPDLLGEILRQLRADIRRAREAGDTLGRLSPRERDVLLGLVLGKRVRQIAQDLAISAGTVRTYLRAIFTKLDVHSRPEAVRVARAAGIEPAAGQS